MPFTSTDNMPKSRSQRVTARGRATWLLAACTVAWSASCAPVPVRPAAAPEVTITPSRVARRNASVTSTSLASLIFDALPPDVPEIEPDPAPSDSAGVERLVTLAQVWHTIALHHPWVATRGAPLDSALIIAVTRVRAAQNDSMLSIAYRKLAGILRDPVTRVESKFTPTPAVIPISVERSADSILIVHIAPTAPLDRDDSVTIATKVDRVLARVVIDMRGVPSLEPEEQALRLETFLLQTALATRLMVGAVTAPTERTRRIGVWPDATISTTDALASTTLRDGWALPFARRYVGIATRTPRTVVLADSGTVLAPVLLALHDASRVSLVADGGLRDASPAARVRVSVSDSLMVAVRIADELHDDGSFDVTPDTTLARSSNASTDVAMERALTFVRGSAPLPQAIRYQLPLRALAATPTFYDSTSYPFMGARLLSGFRLWSAMRARHAHRELYDDDIDAAFHRSIPRLEAAHSATEYARAIAALAAFTDDVSSIPRGESMDDAIGLAALPFRLHSAEGRVFLTDVIKDSTTTALQLVAGAELVSLDGFPIVAWLADHRHTLPASNDWTRLYSETQQMVRGRAGDVAMRVRDLNNRERNITVPRKESYRAALPRIERTEGTVTRVLSEGIAYVDVERLTGVTVDSVMNAVHTARALVLDLRGQLSVDDARLLRHLALRPKVAVARIVQRTLTQPCFATLRDATSDCVDVRETRTWMRSIDTANVTSARVVALIDERTSGAMERFALSLEQMNSVTFVGGASAGAASWTTPLALTGKLSVGIATQDLRRIDGGQLQRIGLTPVIEVRPTARGLRVGEDEVLQRAQQWAQQQLDAVARRRR